MQVLPRLEHEEMSPAWMARALGHLYAAGGILAIVWTVVPHAQDSGDPIVVAMALLAVTLGLTLIWGPTDRLPHWTFHVVIAAIQVVISVGYVAAGPAANDIRLFYAWATPYAAFFFPRRQALAHTAWTGGCLGLSLLLTGAAPALALSVWLMTMGTVVAVGTLVASGARRMRRAQDLLHTAALHDPLTGLLNRLGFADALDTALAQRDEDRGRVVVLLIDLDHFKLVNDSHGHHVGDQMLIEVAPRLVRALREEDVVARMGGDEFAVVCRDPEGRLDLESLLARLRAAWAEPAMLEPGPVPVSGSVGVVRSSGTDDTAESLLRDADVALYRAKAVQRGTAVVYDESLRAQLNREAAVDHALRGAIAHDELSLVFQAVVDLADGSFVGAEALLRWTSAELGPVPPDDFIPIAEDRGLMGDLGTWALEECCRVLAGWRSTGAVDPDFHVALNVSGRQLRPGFAADVAASLASNDLPLHSLCLEITESVLLDDSLATAEAIAELDQLGIRLLLDDFGTGFSSLSYLHRFPLAGLKVDKSFVDAVSSSARQRALVSAMLTMAEALGMSVVAEGVETSDVADTLRTLGCQRAQGYLWARPEPAAVFPLRIARERLERALAQRDSLAG